MGYKESKNTIAEFLVGKGYKEIQFNLENAETGHSVFDKGFSIKASTPDRAEVMGGKDIYMYGMSVMISFIATTNAEYDTAYDSFLSVVNEINSQSSLMDAPTFDRMDEANYFLGTANFYVGSLTCE